MAFLIGGANSAADTGYEVANSCRFETDTVMKRTNAATSTNGTQGCFSTWIKKCNISGTGGGMITGYVDASNFSVIYFDGDQQLNYLEYQSGSSAAFLRTPNIFRDPTAWYHIAFLFDTTQGTAANRVKCYVNGTQITTFDSGGTTQPAEDLTLKIFAASTSLDVGQDTSGSPHFMNGYLAETLLVDGTTVAIGDLGEFDEDSPTIWKPKDISGISVGTNGFYLDYEDSSNLGNAVDGGTDLTETNLAASDQTTDTPTKNYSTWNPVTTATSGSAAYSQGNLQVVTPVSGLGWSISTIGATSGKWYAEVFVVAYASLDRTAIGITGDPIGSLAGNSNIGILTNSLDVGYWQNGYSAVGNSTDTDYGDTFAVDDLMGIALNIDDNEVIFYKNNTAQNSGTAISFTAGSTYHFCLNDGSNGGGNTTVTNFGQDGTFNGNKTAGGNADANGHGDFFYAPPTGFYALNTKNLAEFG